MPRKILITADYSWGKWQEGSPATYMARPTLKPESDHVLKPDGFTRRQPRPPLRPAGAAIWKRLDTRRRIKARVEWRRGVLLNADCARPTLKPESDHVLKPDGFHTATAPPAVEALQVQRYESGWIRGAGSKHEWNGGGESAERRLRAQR